VRDWHSPNYASSNAPHLEQPLIEKPLKNLSYSFKPDGTHFIFDIDTGKTIPIDYPLKTARRARREWVRQRGADNAEDIRQPV
jgi:hypothetical protein